MDDANPHMSPPWTCAQERLVFTADDADGFGAYHDLYAGGSTVSRLGAAFSARVAAYRFPHMLLFDRHVVGAVHHRDAAQVRRDGLDHFTLQVLRSGRMLAGRAGEERAMQSGDVAIYGTTRPQRTVVERANYIALTLPRDVVESAVPDARNLHGRIFPRAVAGLLGDIILSLVQNASAMGAETAARSGAIVADLIAGVAGDLGARASEVDNAGGNLLLHRTRGEAYIEANLHDHSLDADRVALALGLSRATLYRAFAPVDGVARQILRRRLMRLRSALARPGEMRSIAALCFGLGFVSESHCSRAFKQAFGVAPSQFRAGMRNSRPPRAGETQNGLLTWYHDLC